MEKATVYVHKTRYSKHIFDHAKYYSICFMDQEHKNSVIVLCKVMGKSDFDSKSVDENVYEWYQEEGVHSQYYGEIVKILVKDYK